MHARSRDSVLADSDGEVRGVSNEAIPVDEAARCDVEVGTVVDVDRTFDQGWVWEVWGVRCFWVDYAGAVSICSRPGIIYIIEVVDENKLTYTTPSPSLPSTPSRVAR